MMGNAKFLVATILVSLLLLGLIVGTTCLKLTELPAGSDPYTSPTTFWVYAAFAWAIAFVMLVVLLYAAYLWASCCMPAVASACKPKRRTSSCVY